MYSAKASQPLSVAARGHHKEGFYIGFRVNPNIF